MDITPFSTIGQSSEHGSGDLLPQHREMLQNSVISEDVIRERGYKSITDGEELRKLGFAPGQRRVPGLLIPLHTTDGKVDIHVYRPDNPRVEEKKDNGRDPDGTYPNKVIKYEIPKGTGVRLDCPPRCREALADPQTPLWITEGQKKADCLASAGLCTIAMLGVWNFKGKNGYGGTTFLADWDYIALKGRDAYVVFDSDMMSKQSVQQALSRLIDHLHRKGAVVQVIYIPNEPGLGKIGVDDWLANGHSIQELQTLIEPPRVALKPAPLTVELLDYLPDLMRRPLQLVNGRSYAAAWLPVKVTQTEKLGKNGEIIRLNPPVETIEVRLFIVRDDGVIFGDDAQRPMSDLGFSIHLPEKPSPDDRNWSSLSVQAFARGYRPEPVDVFRRIVEIIDQFIDFDRSLADQKTMSELIACYVLSTWHLDAFNVIGNLWINGERGSGKTNLLLVVAELSYLGQLILAGGSYATLRDLADYGATLAFDDAENIANPKLSDPDKRALLLAGNRWGASVTLKEPDGRRGWKLRHVNAYCPRCFSAIRLPDPVLASRSIVVPLIRTPDKRRGNIDPADYIIWKHDRRSLIDDLWALSTSDLTELINWDRWVGVNARLTGRNLQPWRALLAVAAWLEQCGEVGLWSRIEQLSVKYQSERATLELSDFTLLVIRSVIYCAVRAISSNSAKHSGEHRFVFSVAEITDAAIKIAQQEEWDFDADFITHRKVGRVLGALRLPETPRPGGMGSRRRSVTIRELQRLADSYGITLPSDLLTEKETDERVQYQDEHGTNGTNGSSGTGEGSYQISLDDLVKSRDLVKPSDFPDSSKPCYACGKTNWKTHPNGGGIYCGFCHPSTSHS